MTVWRTRCRTAAGTSRPEQAQQKSPLLLDHLVGRDATRTAQPLD
jgi:hypothetical protein